MMTARAQSDHEGDDRPDALAQALHLAWRKLDAFIAYASAWGPGALLRLRPPPDTPNR